MKRMFSLMLTFAMLVCCTCMIAFSSSDTASLDDIINSSASDAASEQGSQGGQQAANQVQSDREKRNQDFIAGLNQAADLTTQVEGVEAATSGIRLIAAWIVQVLSYAITAFLAVRVVLDLAYIGLPFTRGFLANGFAGNPQANQMGANNMGGMNGMGGMGGLGGMNGMGGMGGYGMRGGYGMHGGMGGMGGMNGMGMQAGAQATGLNQQGSVMGRIQWVSNAALNAVSAETSTGQSPFRHYIKDMFLMLILVPILITLAVTGTLTNLGFMLGNLVCDAIESIGDML